MKLQSLRRGMAVVLAVALLCTLIYVPGDITVNAVTADTVEKLLGENWYVNWNGGNLPDTEYLSIVAGGADGSYSLRIGHATENTNICLRYKLYKTDIGLAATEEMGIGMKFAAKVEGSLAGDSWIGIINPVQNPGGNNRANLTEDEIASIGTDWTVIDKDDEYYGVWCGPEYDRAELEFNITLNAGNYFYLDDLQGYGFWGNTGDMAYVNAVKNGSFEENSSEPENPEEDLNDVQKKLGKNWYVHWNGGNAADADYLSIVQGGSHGDYCLRIGHATEPTNICLRYNLYKSDMGLASSEALAVGMKFTAKVEGAFSADTWIGVINPVDPAVGGNRGNLSEEDIASIGSDWTVFDKTHSDYGVWCGGEYDHAKLEFNIVLDAGNYFYLDDLQGYGYYGNIGDMAYVNVVENSSFEQYVPEPEYSEPTVSSFVSAAKHPADWYVSWNEQEQYRSDFLTAQSHSGDYALALTALEANMGHTIATRVEGLEEGAEYIFEGYFKKLGDFSYISLMYGSTFLQLKDWQMDKWTLCTGSFTAGSGNTFSIFTVCPQGGQLLADDLKIYRSDDVSKTNLLTNGDFETSAGSAGAMLKIDKAFTAMPITVEAQLRLPVGAQQCGVLLGNCSQEGKAGYNVGINSQGQPYVSAVLTDGTAVEGVFDGVDVRTGEVVTLAVSNTNGVLTCSVNGEVKQTLAIYIAADVAMYSDAFAIGGDNTAENENYFAGDLITLSVSDSEGVLAAWELENASDPERVADKTGHGYTALYYGEYFDELQSSITEKYPYAFAVVGDTQYTNRGDTQNIIAGADYMGGIYQWIIDNKDTYNIQAVLGMGDIVDTSPSTLDENAMAQSLKEWAHAVESIGKLNDAGIPYTLVKGNHDSISEYPENDTAVFENSMKELGYDTQVDGWYEEGGTFANAYITLTVGETKWLILTLDYNHSESEIAWADSVIKTHADHKVIVTTHAYLNANGQWLDSSDRCDLVGADLWEMLISQHENIELVLCGHIHSSDVVVRQFKGAGNNIVTEMLIDSQSIDRDAYLAAGKAPYAMATLLMFSQDGNEVMVANYATGKDKFYHADAIKTLNLSDGQDIPAPSVTPPLTVPLEDTEIPGWITRWSGNESVNYRYLTTNAYSGKYALALTGTDDTMAYTYGQLLRKLEVGQEYTFEGYVLYSGKFAMLDLMFAGNANKLSLKTFPEEQWNKVTMTFVAGESTVPMELFADGRAKAIVLLDDVTVYKTSDENKTNLVENSGFDVIEEPQIQAPEKTYDYPTDWEVWAENDDKSQLFVTNAAREGDNGFAFVNTAKHASSLIQVVTGLADGVYVLSAFVRSSGGQEDAALLAKGYDRENPEGQSGAKITQSGIWTRIELEFEVNSGQVQVSLWNAGNQGNWIIVDQVELIAKNDTTYTNLLKNSGFETAENELPPQTPIQVELIDTDIPGWVEAWNQNPGTNYRYLTTHANSGKYALALISKQGKISYTFAQRLELQTGVSYTLEGHVYKSGELDSADILIGPNGTDGKISLAEERMNGYQKVKLTFRPSSDYLELGVYASGPQNSLFMLDDLILYRSDDSQKTNLLTNGNFETLEQLQTQPPDRAEELPESWEIWADDEDLSLIYVAEGGRNGGYAMGFDNTKQQAASLAQTVTGLEDGIYVLTAWVKSSGGQNDAAMLLKGYDRENPNGQSGVKIPATGVWVQLRLEAEVNSGQVLVSFWNDANEGNWLMVDGVSLYHKDDAAKTNLLVNGEFENVVKASGGNLPPAGELTGTEPPADDLTQEEPAPAGLGSIVWLCSALGIILFLAVVTAAAIIIVFKKRKRE